MSNKNNDFNFKNLKFIWQICHVRIGEKMRRKICFIVIILILAMFLNGCSFETKQKTNDKSNNKIYAIDKKQEYKPFSQSGIEYTYPSFVKEWSSKELELECIEYSTSKVTTKIYLLRNIHAKEKGTESFSTILNGKDIPQYLEEYVKKYVGEIETSKGTLTYKDNLKFWDCQGVVSKKEKKLNYQAIYFQTNLYMPSVKKQRVPTVFFVTYENKDDSESISNLLDQLKDNIVYPK